MKDLHKLAEIYRPWPSGTIPALEKFINANQISLAQDHDEAPVFLARNAWHLNKAQEDFPKIKFLKTKETFK